VVNLNTLDIVYYSNRSENTKRFVDKLNVERVFRIPTKWDERNPFLVGKQYVLFVPTYGSGNDGYSIPASVKKFLNIPSNRQLLKAVVGFGNTNFGEHYCKAADQIAAKTGVPILGRVELLGTPEDVITISERLTKLNDAIQLS
jgi:protein involved in ribonucleotide reduction